jgi:hypothetical protein
MRAQNPSSFAFLVNCIKIANGYILRFMRAQDFASNPSDLEYEKPIMFCECKLTKNRSSHLAVKLFIGASKHDPLRISLNLIQRSNKSCFLTPPLAFSLIGSGSCLKTFILVFPWPWSDLLNKLTIDFLSIRLPFPLTDGDEPVAARFGDVSPESVEITKDV